MNLSSIQQKVASLPQNPGVYFFRGSKGKILYIGKATNLRSRVASYFRNVISSEVEKSNAKKGSDLSTSSSADEYAQDDTKKMVHVEGRSEWIGRMIGQVENIDFQETESVLEALILESNLIKKHQPKYNTLEKDDKSFAYFVVTKEEFPKLLIVRQTDLFQISNKHTCHPALGAGSSHAHKPGEVLDSRLRGNDNKLQSYDKNFKYKDVLVDKYFGPYTSKQQMQTALKIIRRIFPFHLSKQKSEKGCLDFQIGICPGPYAGAISKADYAKNIRGIKMILEGKKKRLVSTLEKEMQGFAKKNEFEKAGELRNKIFALNHIRDVALMSRDFENANYGGSTSMGEVEPPARIEAYDISNISGQHAVGSMVVFTDGQADKSQYRKFKIKTVDGSNDVAMMREVLLRRFNNDWPMPDLILLDGGLGHLNMAQDLLHKELGLAVNLAAIAKGPTRKKLDIRTDANLRMDPNLQINQILKNDNLVKSIMGEAHRFAITFHRKLRRKNALK